MGSKILPASETTHISNWLTEVSISLNFIQLKTRLIVISATFKPVCASGFSIVPVAFCHGTYDSLFYYFSAFHIRKGSKKVVRFWILKACHSSWWNKCMASECFNLHQKEQACPKSQER